MNSYTVSIGARNVKIPYRVYNDFRPLTFTKSAKLCRKSRHHNGFVREAAIKSLLEMKLSPKEVPYVFLALADYVIEISELPVHSNSETKKAMQKLVQDNEALFVLIEAKTISYWNEYYRKKFRTYSDYPPYKYLQSLR